MSMMLISKDWFSLLIDDCSSIVTESVYRARMELIEGRYELGTRILQDVPNFEREKIYGQKIVQALAESLPIGERTIYYALQFVNKYPDLEEFINSTDEKKNLSWNKIITKYLPEGGEKKEQIKRFKQVTCPYCKGVFDCEIS